MKHRLPSNSGRRTGTGKQAASFRNRLNISFPEVAPLTCGPHHAQVMSGSVSEQRAATDSVDVTGESRNLGSPQLSSMRVDVDTLFNEWDAYEGSEDEISQSSIPPVEAKSAKPLNLWNAIG